MIKDILRKEALSRVTLGLGIGGEREELIRVWVTVTLLYPPARAAEQ